MTSKQVTSKKKSVVKSNPNEIKVTKKDGESAERKLAEVGLYARTQNALTVQAYAKMALGELDIKDVMEVLREKAADVNAGDLSDIEARLSAQIISLDTMFNTMARRSANNMGTHMQATEAYMRLALKAQSQCAKTAEILASLKNPPVVFAKQANIAHGNQQVNNGISVDSDSSRTGKTINQTNELLEVNNGSKEMDSRATQTAIPKDKAMAAVAKKYRGQNS